MSVDGVNNQNSLIGSTLKAGAVGAGLGAAGNYILQKGIQNTPKESMEDTFSSLIKTAKNSNISISEKKIKSLESRKAMCLEIIDTKKINTKYLGKAILKYSALMAGIYLAYRGVKSLLTKKD